MLPGVCAYTDSVCAPADNAAGGTTAVLTMELQRGVVGDAATIRDLAKEVDALGVIDNAARIVGAARSAGARVVHCTAEFRPDRAGSADNSPMLVPVNPFNLLLRGVKHMQSSENGSTTELNLCIPNGLGDDRQITAITGLV